MRTSLGLSANLVGFALRLLQQITLVPLFLIFWGKDLYADWLTITALTAAVALLDVGAQTYLTNAMNERWSRQDPDGFHQLLHTGTVFYTTLILGAGLLTSAAAAIIPWGAFLHLKVLDAEHSRIVVAATAWAVLLNIATGFVTGIYKSIGEYHRGSMLSNGVQAVQLAASATVLVFHGGVLTLVWTLFIPAAVGLPAALWDIHHRHPEVHFGVMEASRKDFIGAARPSLFFMLFPVGQALWLQGTIVVLSTFASAGELVLFTTTRTICFLPRQLLTQFNNAVWPEVTRLFALRDRGTLRVVHRAASGLAVFATALAVGYLLVAGDSVLLAWTAHRVDPDFGLLMLLAMTALVGSVWHTSQIMLLATNSHAQLSVRYVLGGCVTVALAVALARFGAKGVAIAVLVGETAFLGVWVLLRACQLVEDSALRVGVALFGKAAMGVAAGATGIAALRLAIGLNSRWRILAATSIWAMSAACVLAWTLERQPRDLLRRRAMQWLRRVRMSADPEDVAV